MAHFSSAEAEGAIIEESSSKEIGAEALSASESKSSQLSFI